VCEYFLDTTKISLHISEIKEEEKIAIKLQDEIGKIKNEVFHTYNVNSEMLQKFQQLTNDVDNLVYYYKALAMVLEDTSEQAVIAVRHIEELMLENRFNSEAVIRLFDEKN